MYSQNKIYIFLKHKNINFEILAKPGAGAPNLLSHYNFPRMVWDGVLAPGCK
jgi:hypothetical protein